MFVLIGYLVIVNLFGFALMGNDKARAKRRKRRIPERRLFLTAFFGGALGVLLGMNRFRHKTLHPSFKYGIPLLLVLNAAVAAFLFRIVGG
ncbi:DUF1294 domain-containing protein [Gorillibacterium sp. sgz500922]|uniref:DUF1294 domain-containing protein n=1 Tax=Gorillibacterium sp. sgz500922 TaxID=3446694 RepID=UPI003F670DAC